MSETVFSKIINHEIPAEIIYEDEHTLVFLDINPVNRGHALVIPKAPFVNIFDGDPEVLAQMMRVAQQVSVTVKEAVNADGVNLIMNNGADAGQEVFHAHLHVIPRFKDDKSFSTPNHVTYAEGEATALATQLRSALEE